MKIAAYILAFYLILLAAVPCCAVEYCPEDAAELAADQENNEEDCGNCSPFFNCEGCATTSISVEPINFGINSFDIILVYNDYILTTLPGIEFDFWQPPRMTPLV